MPPAVASWSQFTEEVRILTLSTLPLALTLLLQITQVSITLLFAGRIGKNELAAASLATLTASVTGWAVIHGLVSTMDTLCSEAFGKGSSKMVDMYAQGMILLLCCASIITMICWHYCDDLFRLMVTDEDICGLASQFLRTLSWGYPGFAFFECGKRYLQIQGHFCAGLYVLIIGVAMHTCLAWYTVRVMENGFLAVGISLSVIRTILPLGLFLYAWIFTDIHFRPERITSALLEHCGLMLKIALPICLMTQAGYLAFEIQIVLAGFLGTAVLGAQTCLCSLISITYAFPSQLGVAASTRISILLGRRSALEAQVAARAAIVLGTGIGFANFALVLYFRNEIPHVFTNDVDIVRAMVPALPLFTVFQLSDAACGVLEGIMRSLGKQNFSAWVRISVHFLVGLPCSVLAAFWLGWGLPGLWLGLFIAVSVIPGIEGTCAYLSQWDRLIPHISEAMIDLIMV
ncbi:MATE efflux family protein [Stipitochalara longipes BDJ]|nr:MATE efflux family protein [Stipitochalara longipes BDJ]